MEEMADALDPYEGGEEWKKMTAPFFMLGRISPVKRLFFMLFLSEERSIDHERKRYPLDTAFQ